MEECVRAFEKEKERLNNIITEYKEKNNELENEIKELNERSKDAKIISEEKERIYEVKISNYNSLFQKNSDLVMKLKEKELEEKNILKKAKEEEYLRVRDIFAKEINGLIEVIQSILGKDKASFDKSLEKLSHESNKNLTNLVNLYRPDFLKKNN